MKSLIQEVRKSKGLMQSYVAKQMDISQQVLSNWERGDALPRLDKAFKLAKVLGVSVYDLWELDD